MPIAKTTLQGLIGFVTMALAGLSFAEANEGWVFTVAPYVWATGMEGEVATLPPADPADIDLSFGNVLEDLDLSLMSFAEARKGRIGFFAEIFYVSVSTDAETPGRIYSGAAYQQDFWALSIGGSFAVIQDQAQHIDVVGGIRFWDLDNEINLKAGVAAAADRTEHENWTDFIVGARGRARLGQRWYLTGWAVSAVAGDSDSAWDVLATIGYEMGDDFMLTVGYRHQEVDYQDGDFLFDVEMSGPVIGLVWRL